LRRFLERPPPPRAGERCEICGELIADVHGHVVEVDKRRLMCTCRPCALLFSNPGAGRGRFRLVPERFLSAPEFRLSHSVWEQLAIPVSLAFFFRNSTIDRVVCFYPSPAGATESLLAMDHWQEVMADNPLVGLLEDDVEGLIVRRIDDGCITYLAPIDSCYELVGHVRMNWRGFDGGTEAWERIDAFFNELAERSTPVEAAEQGSTPVDA
jgi:hypothetical protein